MSKNRGRRIYILQEENIVSGSVRVSTELKQRVYESVLSQLRETIAANKTKTEETINSLREVQLPHEFSEVYAFRRGLCEQNYAAKQKIDAAQKCLQELQRLSASSGNIITEGTLVETLDRARDATEIYLLIPTLGQIRFMGELHVDLASPQSPVGRALIGHLAGETVAVQTPNGPRALEIRAVV